MYSQIMPSYANYFGKAFKRYANKKSKAGYQNIPKRLVYYII